MLWLPSIRIKLFQVVLRIPQICVNSHLTNKCVFKMVPKKNVELCLFIFMRRKTIFLNYIFRKFSENFLKRQHWGYHYFHLSRRRRPYEYLHVYDELTYAQWNSLKTWGILLFIVSRLSAAGGVWTKMKDLIQAGA